jgi:D-alanyl-D-alanine carboxypeptidase
VDTSLDHLAPEFRPLAFELIARCVEARIPIVIINTLRTSAEQAAELAAGNSWTPNSKHLPQPPSGLSLAIDIAPLAQYTEHGESKIDWDDSDSNWNLIGAIGIKLGLRWGKSFPKPDLGHFEYVKPNEQLSHT